MCTGTIVVPEKNEFVWTHRRFINRIELRMWIIRAGDLTVSV